MKYKNILTKEFLEREYTDNKRSSCQISKMVNCTQTTIINYLKKYNIGRRTFKEINSGITHPNYKNGITLKKYKCPDCGKEIGYQATRCRSCASKNQIRKRDDYKCQNCGITEEEHIMVFGQVLTVHHIDYDKMNCEEDNLITTCNACNSRANINREYWKKYYKGLICSLKR